MALRGKSPTKVEKRLKALFYGPAGVGKTMTAIQFPKPYLIDTERGAQNDQYVSILAQSGGAIFNTADFDEMIKEVKSLLTEKHGFKTLIIDPLTIVYNDLLEKAMIKVGTEFGRHYAEANRHMKHLLNLLLRLDMNVLITAHSKNEYGQNLAVLGQTFDCYKKLDYLFDLVLEIQKRGKERIAIIKKTRIEGFPDNESFGFNFDDMASRYGLTLLEKEMVPEVLASEEQVIQLNRLIELLNIGPDVVEKWMTKANAETLEEMPTDSIQKCIDYLLTKIAGE